MSQQSLTRKARQFRPATTSTKPVSPSKLRTVQSASEPDDLEADYDSEEEDEVVSFLDEPPPPRPLLKRHLPWDRLDETSRAERAWHIATLSRCWPGSSHEDWFPKQHRPATMPDFPFEWATSYLKAMAELALITQNANHVSRMRMRQVVEQRRGDGKAKLAAGDIEEATKKEKTIRDPRFQAVLLDESLETLAGNFEAKMTILDWDLK